MKAKVTEHALRIDIAVEPESTHKIAQGRARAAAHRVAAELELFAANEGRPYTVSTFGTTVQLDFTAELDAPETRESAHAIALEIALDATAAAGLDAYPGEEGAA